jgi:hypothetical protein
LLDAFDVSSGERRIKRIKAHWANIDSTLQDSFDKFKTKREQLGDDVKAAKATFTGKTA